MSVYVIYCVILTFCKYNTEKKITNSVNVILVVDKNIFYYLHFNYFVLQCN